MLFTSLPKSMSPEAKKIALDTNKNVNGCNEYRDGYHFIQKKEEEWEGDSGFVVLKDSGIVIRWMDFIMDYSPERDAKVLDFETGEVIARLFEEEEK